MCALCVDSATWLQCHLAQFYTKCVWQLPSVCVSLFGVGLLVCAGCSQVSLVVRPSISFIWCGEYRSAVKVSTCNTLPPPKNIAASQMLWGQGPVQALKSTVLLLHVHLCMDCLLPVVLRNKALSSSSCTHRGNSRLSQSGRPQEWAGLHQPLQPSPAAPQPLQHNDNNKDDAH